MNPMIYIRKLLDGRVNYDLTNPFKNAFIECPECGDVMLLDREAWSAECFKCFHAECDIPGMVINRTGLSREEACVSYGIFLETGVFSLAGNLSFEKMGAMALQLRGSMAEAQSNHAKLVNNQFLLEAFNLYSGTSKAAAENGSIGIMVDGDHGVFLIPEIEMFSLITSIEVISMHDASMRIRHVLVATSHD